MNWRKPLIFGLLHLTRSKIPRYLKEIERLQYKPEEEIREHQENKLNKLLLHAYRNVPYYHRVLKEAEVVVNGEINLNKFSKIPILTKEIIKKNFNELKSKDLNKRKWYYNTSGGSTGVPVRFIQDKEFKVKNYANKIYYALMAGKELGEREIKLWGSERDIIEGSETIKSRMLNWLYNRKLLNSFRMNENDMKRYVEMFNKFRPVNVWVYVDSIYELARFIERNNLEVYSPNSIVVTAGTLNQKVRKFVEDIFRTKVINQYGSREVGDIAVECRKQEGLHIFEDTQYIEVLDENIEPKNGGIGEVYITNLTNFSMPLIRYKIGDTARITDKKCSCGRGFRLLENVTGRITDHFIRKDGTIIHGEYFTHLFYFKDWVKKFQVVQKDYDLVVCKVVLERNKNEEDMKDIEEKIKLVMGKDCKAKFEFVDEIEPTKSGKYLYTTSEVKNDKK